MAVETNRYLGTGWQGQGLRADEGQWIPDRTLIVDRPLWFFSTGIRYLVIARPDRTPNVWYMDTAESNKPPRAAQTKLIVPATDYREHLELLLHPSLIHVHVGPMAGGFQDNVEPFLLYLSFTTEPLPKSSSLPVDRLGDAITLQAAQGKASCKQLNIELAWQAMRALDVDYTAFVHVIESDKLVAQSDGQPGDGFYPTSWWQPSDWIADTRTIRLSAPFNPIRQRVTVGMYLLDEASVPKTFGAPTDITDRIVNQCNR
jgi:hypothetical protein